MYELHLDHVKGPEYGMQPKALIGEIAFKKLCLPLQQQKKRTCLIRILHFTGML